MIPKRFVIAHFYFEWQLEISDYLEKNITALLAECRFANYKPDTSNSIYKHGLTLITAWISNHMPSNMWDEITYPFLNFNGCTVEV